ncbi:MAG TPA: ATP-binding cassette domain-containing protein [Acidimicrobiia bacterium]|jgi:ABC-type branched-subunit amino acid transport system ATPase component/ABC-type branched-subunit amino acid transport system permease subunit|nr:ATP-binding cassette domain-containing protein [Acidimicrobiia bacterium]
MPAPLLRRPVLLVGIALAVAFPFFAENSTIFTVTGGLVLGIAALGLVAVVGWSREVSLVQAGLTGTAAYVSGYLYRSVGGKGLPFVVAALLATAVVVGLSMLVALGTARLSGIYIMILTLALQIVIEKTFFKAASLTGGLNAVTTPRPWLVGLDLEQDRTFYFFVLAVVAVMVLLMARLRRSRFGRSLLLVGADRKAAASVGISPWSYKIFAFALAGVFAGVAGALSAPLYHSPPGTGAYTTLNSLLYLSIPVVAGFASLWSVVVVGVVFTWAPQALESYHLSPFILAGAALSVGILVGSRGVSGAIVDLVARFRRRRTDVVVDDDPAIRAERRRRALEVVETYIPARQDGGDALVGTNLSIAFGGVQALHDVDVTIPLHRFVGLLGPNGAGKSTLFDALGGLKRPDTGTVQLFGHDVTATPAWDRAKLGMSRTFQANRLHPDLTVAENLLAGAHRMLHGSLAGALLGLPGARAEEARGEAAARAIAALLDLEALYDQRAGDLDWGSQRRVEIGRSLMSGPRLLLLDEPAAGLDSDEAHGLFALVRRLQADLGLTVLLVEHYVKAVLENADVVYVLNQGKVLAAGTPEEIAAHPEVRVEYLGSANFLLNKLEEERVDA